MRELANLRISEHLEYQPDLTAHVVRDCDGSSSFAFGFKPIEVVNKALHEIVSIDTFPTIKLRKSFVNPVMKRLANYFAGGVAAARLHLMLHQLR